MVPLRDGVTEFFDIANGVFHGDNLAPFIFIITKNTTFKHQ